MSAVVENESTTESTTQDPDSGSEVVKMNATAWKSYLKTAGDEFDSSFAPVKEHDKVGDSLVITLGSTALAIRETFKEQGKMESFKRWAQARLGYVFHDEVVDGVTTEVAYQGERYSFSWLEDAMRKASVYVGLPEDLQAVVRNEDLARLYKLGSANPSEDDTAKRAEFVQRFKVDEGLKSREATTAIENAVKEHIAQAGGQEAIDEQARKDREKAIRKHKALVTSIKEPMNKALNKVRGVTDVGAAFQIGLIAGAAIGCNNRGATETELLAAVNETFGVWREQQAEAAAKKAAKEQKETAKAAA